MFFTIIFLKVVLINKKKSDKTRKKIYNFFHIFIFEFYFCFSTDELEYDRKTGVFFL